MFLIIIMNTIHSEVIDLELAILNRNKTNKILKMASESKKRKTKTSSRT